MRLVRFFQCFNLFAIEFHLKCFDRFIKMVRFGGPYDGSDNAIPMQYPGQRDLRAGYSSFVSKLNDSVNNREIGFLVIEALRELIGLSAGGFTRCLATAISGQKLSR